ncbi:hypothetical protein ACFS3C_16080 [Azotobacter vinelandii]
MARGESAGQFGALERGDRSPADLHLRPTEGQRSPQGGMETGPRKKYNVDLVLQGHDHCYSRLSAEAGHEAALAARAAGAVQGPVYLVSVAGSKMYRLNDRARRQPDRVAEDTQFYETVEVESQRLAVRTYTASGRLYDAFDLLRDAQGGKHLIEPVANLPAERTCDGEQGPDGLPCTALGNARG